MSLYGKQNIARKYYSQHIFSTTQHAEGKWWWIKKQDSKRSTDKNKSWKAGNGEAQPRHTDFCGFDTNLVKIESFRSVRSM